jgi:glycerate dehydrogenase
MSNIIIIPTLSFLACWANNQSFNQGGYMRITKVNHIEYYPNTLPVLFKKIGEYIEYDDAPTEDVVIERLARTDIAIVEWYTPITSKILSAVSGRLKHIVVPLTDYTHIDVKAAKKLGITVANCPNTSTQAVAEHLFALLGAANRKLILADRLVREGKRDYYEPFLAIELAGKTLGILGLGTIGKYAAKIGLGYDMVVFGHIRTPKKLELVKDVELDYLLKHSDIVFVTLESNASTKALLSRKMLSQMKVSSFLISISNKEIIDEQAVFDMLENGHLAGAGLDQLQDQSPLINSDKIVLSPGTAWLTQQTFDRLFNTVYQNVNSFILGSPINVVD